MQAVSHDVFSLLSTVGITLAIALLALAYLKKGLSWTQFYEALKLKGVNE